MVGGGGGPPPPRGGGVSPRPLFVACRTRDEAAAAACLWLPPLSAALVREPSVAPTLGALLRCAINVAVDADADADASAGGGGGSAGARER